MAVTSVTLTVSISRPATEAFRFLADPATMSQWAIHNVKSIRPLGQNQWEIQTPRRAGRFIPHFEPSFGILDHEFIDPKEGSWQVAARIVSAGSNDSVYMITLVKPPSNAHHSLYSGNTARRRRAANNEDHPRTAPLKHGGSVGCVKPPHSPPSPPTASAQPVDSCASPALPLPASQPCPYPAAAPPILAVQHRRAYKTLPDATQSAPHCLPAAPYTLVPQCRHRDDCPDSRQTSSCARETRHAAPFFRA